MKQLFTLFIAFSTLCFSVETSAQTPTVKQQKKVDKLFKKRGEVYFKFNISSRAEITTLTKIISIDNVKNNEVFAYANKDGFSKFIVLNYSYTVLPNPNTLHKVKMGKKKSLTKARTIWDTYPTYPDYEAIMSQFVADHPSICKLVSIATLPSGRKLLLLKITDNINVKENEPQFLYTSTMHGDETAGYIGMLHYIDYLLSNYGTDTRITNLVNSVEIWINPLANPDGAYAGGNSTINGATRYNANNVDLNRNYPDPQAGQHPDGYGWQPETQAFMAFADTMNFVMSANFHGGAEVANYPWDTWAQLNADDNWWIRESSKYADTAMANAPAGYFTSVSPNGITNGYAWYQVTGGRQDYMTYYKHCREFTLELSDIKLVPTTDLLTNWDNNYRSFTNYLEESLHGIRGIIKDSCTNLAIRADVSIIGHDFDNSDVYSYPPIGDYHRPIYQGTYNVTFSAPGYQSRTINNVVVTDGNATIVNVYLKPIIPTADFSASLVSVCNGTLNFNDSTGSANSWHWSFGDGGTSSLQNPTHIYTASGTYSIKLKVSNCAGADSIIKTNYVNVTVIDTPIVQSASAVGCGPESLTLTASASGTINWYNAASGGNLINTGISYTTPLLSNATTYYVENDAGGVTQYVGALNNSIGSGGYYASTGYHYLMFTASVAFKLVSVWVDANTAGSRTVELRDGSGTVLQSAIINIPMGQSRIILNFNVAVGTDLQLGIDGGNDLFRNSSGASYPYSLSGVVSITGNSAGDPGYYYYFYDWEISQPCTSNRVAVSANINPVLPAPVITLSGDTLYSSASTGNQWYSVSSGLITGANGTYYLPLQNGSFYVVVNDGNVCSPDTSNVLSLNYIGIVENSKGSIRIFPNPNNGTFTVDLSIFNNTTVALEIYDLFGKLLFSELTQEKSVKINIMNFDNAIYFMKISGDNNTITQKIIIRMVN